MKKQIKINGRVDSIRYKNEDNGYCVLMLNTDDDLIPVVGNMGNVEEGEELTLTGSFEINREYGEQFRAVLFERSLPTTSAEIFRYLSSGAISGIGPAIARQLVSKFGDDTLKVIENSPEKLTVISGISSKKARDICGEFKQTFAVRTLLMYLNKFEIETVISIRAWKRWGNCALDTIKSNPYALCVDGIGLSFTKADKIAASEGISSDSEQRIRAGISCVLNENADQGHTCLPLDKLEIMCTNFLKITKEQFENTLEREISEENLFYYYKQERPFVMLRDYYKAEDYISRRLEIMREISYDNEIDFSAVIDLEEQNNGIKYENIQRKAINLALSKGFLVMTGGPGTGKTTTLNAIISLYEQQGLNVMIAAPTGRAAKRISDLTGYDAKTIHRLLEVQYNKDDTLSFIHNENNLLSCDALVVDEMSMVDARLFEALLRAISITCKLVLVGDSDQLPSVGAGNVLRDIIDSGVMSVVTLKEIFRQARESDIVMNAHKIVEGQSVDFTKRSGDFCFIQRLDYEGIQQLVVDLCETRLPKKYNCSPFDDIQVLSPTRKGPSGTDELNKLLQQRLNPFGAGKSQVKHNGSIYRTGDKVMQTKNDYEIQWKKTVDDQHSELGTGIFNGDIGRIIAVNKVLKTVTIDFEGRVAVYNKQMLDNLELAYAVTVHKSQGSEFDIVILTVFKGYDKLYYRNLLYTAVTRAKKLLIIVGSKNRVEFMINNNHRTDRYTALKNMLMTNAEGDDSGQQKLDLQI